MMKNRFGGFLRSITDRTYNWKMIVYATIGLGITASLYIYKLSSLLVGYSVQESIYARQPLIVDGLPSAIGIPHLLITKLFAFIVSDEFAARLASASLAILSVVLFFMLIKKWHSMRVATISSIVFASAAFMLHSGRYGGYMIVAAPLFLGLLLLALRIKYRPLGKDSQWLLYLTTILLVSSLYVPGMIWFAVLLVVLGFKHLRSIIHRQHIITKWVAGLLGLGLLIPLALYVAKLPVMGIQLITGVSYSGELTSNLEGLWQLPKYLFVGGASNPEFWLSDLSILDVFTIVMLLLGSYYYFRNRSDLARFRYVAGSLLLAYLVAALGGFIAMYVVLFVLLFIIVAAGIDELLSRWYVVFPYNPVARTFGLGMLVLLSLLVVFYNTRYYFVAWPGSPETKQVYTVKSDTIEQN